MEPEMKLLTRVDLTKKIELYADGVDLESMPKMVKEYGVTGFTTNPTLMANLGVKDYKLFAKEALSRSQGYPVSFEVIGDELGEMKRQAQLIASWGKDVYVKIPISNSKGAPTYELIKDLNSEGIKLNITAIFTKEQINGLEDCLHHAPSIVSIFAGRIADTGLDPSDTIRYAVKKFKDQPYVRVLWASTREVYNIIQAIDSGAHIITVTKDIIKKTNNIGKDLTDFSRETVQMFLDDATKSGFKL
jgi:transaldolase